MAENSRVDGDSISHIGQSPLHVNDSAGHFGTVFLDSWTRQLGKSSGISAIFTRASGLQCSFSGRYRSVACRLYFRQDVDRRRWGQTEFRELLLLSDGDR
jgi:hypothetical protein